jgi:hypothetical protein
MARVAEEEGARFSDPDDLNSQVREYVALKKTMEGLDARHKELRDKLFERITLTGEEDDKGNIQLELDVEIDGVRRIEKQRRVTRKIDEDKAAEIIEALGLKEELYVMQPVLQEDLLMAAHWDGKISEEQIDEMFPSKVVWALMTKKN